MELRPTAEVPNGVVGSDLPACADRNRENENVVKLICGALAAGWGGGCLPRDNPAVPPSPLFSAEELAKFMGTREERAARAPYSPPAGRSSGATRFLSIATGS